jgi:hypothetical protein
MRVEMMYAFEQPYQGLRFAIPDGTQDGLSWGGNPTYADPDGANG